MTASNPPGETALPTTQRLKSAVRAARVVAGGSTAITAARSAYIELPSGGLIAQADLIAAEQWLVELGLLDRDESHLHPSEHLQQIAALDDQEAAEMLLAIALAKEPPLWLLVGSAGGSLDDSAIPDADADVLDGAIPDPERREAFLLSLGQKHDEARRSEIGRIGEEFVVEECRNALEELGAPELASQVLQASDISDALGYDVTAPRVSGGKIRLEVKTTTAAGTNLSVYLSRNEMRTALGDPDWSLVVCRLDAEDTPSLAGWCAPDVIRPLLPADPPERGSWQSAQVVLGSDDLNPGLPALD